MSERLANIRRGSADVILGGERVGWVVRNTYDHYDEDEGLTGRVYYLWDAVTLDERGDGVITGMAHSHRRDAVQALVRQVED